MALWVSMLAAGLAMLLHWFRLSPLAVGFAWTSIVSALKLIEHGYNHGVAALWLLGLLVSVGGLALCGRLSDHWSRWLALPALFALLVVLGITDLNLAFD